MNQANTGHIVNNDVFKSKKKTILLKTAFEVIKYFKGDIPDYSDDIILSLPDDIRVTKELYLRSLQILEEAKHIEL